jgi:transglutaminase-like putative cysteine protease
MIKMEITKDEVIEIRMFNNALTTTDPREIRAIFNSKIFNSSDISEIGKYSIAITISENPMTPEDIRKRSKEIIYNIQMRRRESAFLRLERKEPEAVKPKPSDILPSRSSNGYDIIMPETSDSEFVILKMEADRFAGDTKGLVRAYKLSEFVYKNMKYDENWNKKPIVNLSEAIEKREGVCKEMALTLYMLLASNDFDVGYVKGYLISDNGERDGHAWVRLRLYNVDYLIDPTNSIFIPYDLDFVRRHYEEVDPDIKRAIR